jgi:hypothetical protein
MASRRICCRTTAIRHRRQDRTHGIRLAGQKARWCRGVLDQLIDRRNDYAQHTAGMSDVPCTAECGAKSPEFLPQSSVCDSIAKRASQPMHHLASVDSSGAAWAAPTGFARAPPTGGVHEPQACMRLPSTTDSWAPEPLSSGAIPSAGARQATRARRRGCAGLRAESPRSGSARTAGTPAACLLPPACGRPCGRCTRRRR